MKTILKTILFFILFSTNLEAQKIVQQEKCPKIYKTNYTEILVEKYLTISNNDTIKFNEIRFECVFSALYTHKVMFDKFGKWDKEIYPNNSNLPILLWENVDLYSNGKKYNVFTTGLEEWKHIYASVMVFDNNYIDLITDDSLEKENLINYFSDLIKKNKTYRKNFYEEYRKMVDKKKQEL
ncbi:hypothetical protein [uncultured Flavobacterium sp.]|uniref:hypothetical protein n=1 Tax=uncultured Flavobacterium sp. TaxID=165435 RepID=UPI0030ED4228|tara:strand:+ start:98477 stop:99019 length:543 start_codon:yes stop_codon:yes gene_type:complete